MQSALRSIGKNAKSERATQNITIAWLAMVRIARRIDRYLTQQVACDELESAPPAATVAPTQSKLRGGSVGVCGFIGTNCRIEIRGHPLLS